MEATRTGRLTSSSLQSDGTLCSLFYMRARGKYILTEFFEFYVYLFYPFVHVMFEIHVTLIRVIGL